MAGDLMLELGERRLARFGEIELLRATAAARHLDGEAAGAGEFLM